MADMADGVRPPQPRLPAALLRVRWEHARSWPTLIWCAPAGWRAISTALMGGGIGPIAWWLNAMVAREYFHPEPAEDVRQIASGLGLAGPGVGMLTAADVTRRASATEDGVLCVASVGLGLPVWAAASPAQIAREGLGPGSAPAIGTINVLVAVPVPMEDAALVNAVLTATEAKTQALWEAGVPGTGTSSDAICVAAPVGGRQGTAQAYGGPRSVWGQRVARAVHRAVLTGTRGWLSEHNGPRQFSPPPPHPPPRDHGSYEPRSWKFCGLAYPEVP